MVVSCPGVPDRYSRQEPILGVEGQERLSRSSVAVVGLGGLGSIVSMYLAAAGVGRLVVVDSDVVEWNNLNRQLLYDEASVGLPKAYIAARRLRSLNSCVEVEARAERVTRGNAEEVLGGVDLVVDALDNWETRLVLDWYSRKTGTPLLHAAVESFYGQVLLVVPGETACLACIAPRGAPRRRGPIPVVGAAVGVVASLQALTAIRYLAGLPVEKGVLFVVDTMHGEISRVPLEPGCGCG